MINGYNTIGGINLSLSNHSNSNITITDISILSESVRFNTFFLTEREPCDYRATVVDCLALNDYSFTTYNVYETMNSLLSPKNSTSYYIPLSYLDSPFIHRFGIQLTYTIDGEERLYILDDFPFMKTSLFQEEYEDNYHVYTINHD